MTQEQQRHARICVEGGMEPNEIARVMRVDVAYVWHAVFPMLERFPALRDLNAERHKAYTPRRAA
jgi:hypothetical protein